jgi:hypothetical protein
MEDLAERLWNKAQPTRLASGQSRAGMPTMRIRIYKGGYDPERMNLLLMIVMLAVMGSAIFYLGETLSVPTHRIAIVAPVSPL